VTGNCGYCGKPLTGLADDPDVAASEIREPMMHMACGIEFVQEIAEAYRKTCQFVYRAGTSGLGHLGLRDAGPHWGCTCGEFYFAARPMSRRKTGNNEIEAKRAWKWHAHPDEAPDIT
jgi:hypothetical protein